MKIDRPDRRSARCSIALSSMMLLILFISVSTVHAASSYFSTFMSTYPGSGTSSGSCQICHASSTQNVNPYGTDFCNQGGGASGRMASIEGADSDGEGNDNITEINAGAQPGWTTTAVPIASRGSCNQNGTESAPTFIALLDPETAGPEICDNGVDDNGDGLADCADPQCDNAVVGSTTCGVGACGATGDLICQSGAEVDTCTPGAAEGEGPFGDPSCSDGIDNNCDGLTDMADPNCEMPIEICDNGIDDNLDGAVDCEDTQCEGFVYADTQCGVGACGATGQEVCMGGVITDTCDPGTPGGEGPFGDPSCSDGIDNDCDGDTDGLDADCVATAEICDNGIDDNLNGLTDCADPQCEGVVLGTACSTGLPGVCAAGTDVCLGGSQVCEQNQPADTEGPFGDPSCDDTLDNDCDGMADAGDPDCYQQPEICDNGIDDNGDGLADCADPMCDGFVGGACNTGLMGVCATGTSVCRTGAEFCDQTTPAGSEGPFGDPSCGDSLDNDCDGATDAEDTECNAPPESCDNGADDNGNGLVDCEDAQCDGVTFGACDTGNAGVCAAGTLTCDGSAAGPVCVQDDAAGIEGPAGSASCSDGIDNDCDGLSDAADPDCTTVAEICDDGIDNDGDGAADCADSECDGFTLGACDTGNAGVCAAGTAVCQGGGEACVQDQAAGTEGPSGSPTCLDGLDNDCDGTVDGSDTDCAEPVGADVYIDELKRVENYRGEIGHVEKKTVKVKVGGSDTNQSATVALSADTSSNLRVDIRRASRTVTVGPDEGAEKVEFRAYISCVGGGRGTVDWTATIDAAANDDPSNDSDTSSTRVYCSGEKEDDEGRRWRYRRDRDED